MTIQERLTEEMKKAMKEKNSEFLEIIRGIKSVIKNYCIEVGSNELSDSDVIKLIKSEIKKRHDSIELYKQGGRDDLAQKELFEIESLQNFLPEQLSEEQVLAIVDRHISQFNSVSMKDMGSIISGVVKEIGDAADNSMIARFVGERIRKAV